MQTVLLVIYLMVVVALIGVVLIQRSEGGGLGIGGGSGFMSARGTANALTRTTAILATLFLRHLARAGHFGPLRIPPDRHSRSDPGRQRHHPAGHRWRQRSRPASRAAPAQPSTTAPAGSTPAAPATTPAAPAAPAPAADPNAVPNN